ncbi:hypothetical protein VP01_7831g1, partial [Puccinia sorghi]
VLLVCSGPLELPQQIPIEQSTGNFDEDDLEVQGGEFVFPAYSCGIKFSGFNGIFQCACKATIYSCLTLPSHNPYLSSNNFMGISYMTNIISDSYSSNKH